MAASRAVPLSTLARTKTITRSLPCSYHIYRMNCEKGCITKKFQTVVMLFAVVVVVVAKPFPKKVSFCNPERFKTIPRIMPHCLRNNLVCRDFFFPGGGDTSPGLSSFKILFFSFPGYKLYPFYYI